MNKLYKNYYYFTYFGRKVACLVSSISAHAKNDTIQWLFFTDCEIPKAKYSNIEFESMNLEQLNDLASKKLGFRVQNTSYSQMNLRPAFSVIFEEYVKGFDFWGYCDIDVVWGNIRGFITESILQQYDIVSCRKDFLAGHLTLWRNRPDINILFRSIPAYKAIFSSSDHYNFDESIISMHIKRLIATGNSKVKVYWPNQMIVWFHGDSNPNGWYWMDGKVFDATNREHIYLHFQEAKKFIKQIDFQNGDRPSRFLLDRFGGIRSRQPPC
jgi:hypothetical protein